MIRINLLGTPKPKKGRRTGFAMPVTTTGGPSVAMVAALLVAIAGAGNYYYYHQVNKAHEKIQADMVTADRQIKDLSAVKTAYLEKQKQADQLKRQFDVIDQLRSNQSGPVTLLSTIGNTVNASDAVWLDTMLDSGNTIELNGTALSAVAVAGFMTNLKKTGYFKSVELKETMQQDYKNMRAFSFTLICEKQQKV